MSQNHHGSALPPSFLPQKFQILSGSALKLIAIFLTVSAGISDGLHFLFSVFFCWKAFPIPETEKITAEICFSLP